MEMKAVILGLVAIAAGGGLVHGAGFQKVGRDRLASFLPAEARGWKAKSADQVFDAETIFDYIDGAGEVYRAFNMKLLVSRTFTKAGAPDLIADVFDMGSSADAFGVFAHDLDGEEWGIGQGSRYKDGLLQFWRGRTFVSLFAESETAETPATLREIGQAVAAAAGPDGPKPDLLDRLPPDYRSGPVRYLHSPVILNYHFFVARENILNLGPTTEAVIGEKGEKRAASRLLLVRYPSPEEAAAALRSFLAAYMPDERADRTVRTEDGRWTAADSSGPLVCVVFQAPTEAEAKAARAAALSGTADR